MLSFFALSFDFFENLCSKIKPELPVEKDVAMGSVQTMHVFSALTVVSAAGAFPPSRDPPEARFTLR